MVSITLTSLPLTAQYADRLVGAVSDECQIACRIKAQARWLLADHNRAGNLWRIRLQVDDIYFVVWAHFELVAVLSNVHWFAMNAIELVGSMAKLTGGPITEFLSGMLATTFGFSGLARSRISTVSFPAGRKDRCTFIVPQQFLVISNDQGHKSSAPTGKHRVSEHKNPRSVMLHNFREGCFEVAFARGSNDLNPLSC